MDDAPFSKEKEVTPIKLPEALRILKARLSESLSPAEANELELSALAIEAATDLNEYLAKVNTETHQGVIFGSPEDDPEGIAFIGFFERLVKMSQALRGK